VDGPRQARPEEIEALTDFIAAIFGFTEYGRDYMIAGMRRPIMDTARVIVEDGEPVSYIHSQEYPFSICGCTTRVSSIGCVCTREDRRNRGYAGAILAHHITRLAATGVRLMIVSGSRTLYQRNHCVYASVSYDAKITPGPFPSAPPGASVRRVTLDDWPTLAPLYQAEPAHFVRPADLEQHLCFWWNCNGLDIFLIESDGRPVAYIALGRHRWREERGRWVAEYAGSRAALLDALPLLFEATGSSLIVWPALAHDTDLRYRFSRLGIETEWHEASGTIRLVDLPGLMSDLRDYVTARVPAADLARLSFAQEGELCTFALGEERAQLDLSGAARLVFGHLGPEAPEVKGDLGRVLSAIFPLPTIQPGFNYV
jgi:predicted N-acetyltransferase YhbS